jgi:hypothetical protein
LYYSKVGKANQTIRRKNYMSARLKKLGVVLAALGLIFVAGGVVAFTKVQAGAGSLQAFSAAQDVNLTYNEDGHLVDRGTVEGAQAILSLLKDDWKYPVVNSELNPDDPLVNTGTEYMYQMATIAYHTLHGTQSVTLTEDVEYNGTTYAAGTYDVAVDGRYYSQFDRSNPLDGPTRDKAWSATAHALIAELGVGSVTASTLQMGYGLSALIAGIGLTSILAGLGLIWVARGESITVEKAPARAPVKAKAKA